MPDDATYKISAVNRQREWSSQHGPMVSYYIEFDGLDGEHELAQKASTPMPAVGQDLFGHSEDGGQWPSGDPKPRKFRKGQGSGFRQSPQGGGGRDLSPGAQARIDASGRAQGRAHAQEMALRWFGLKGTPDGLSDLTAAIDWFYDDAQAAKAKGYRS